MQVAYKHEMHFAWKYFCKFYLFLKIFEGIKISQNRFLENSILKFARLFACKSLIYLNLYKSKWVLARRFILT